MIGNEAVALGLYEAGCAVVSSYPGTPSTEITEYAAKYDEIYCEWAPNEKVALEVAYGASLGGRRAACAMKHVGLNVAADPLFTLLHRSQRGTGHLRCRRPRNALLAKRAGLKALRYCRQSPDARAGRLGRVPRLCRAGL